MVSTGNLLMKEDGDSLRLSCDGVERQAIGFAINVIGKESVKCLHCLHCRDC